MVLLCELIALRSTAGVAHWDHGSGFRQTYGLNADTCNELLVAK